MDLQIAAAVVVSSTAMAAEKNFWSVQSFLLFKQNSVIDRNSAFQNRNRCSPAEHACKPKYFKPLGERETSACFFHYLFWLRAVLRGYMFHSIKMRIFLMIAVQ